jgi:hypothetical protein
MKFIMTQTFRRYRDLCAKGVSVFDGGVHLGDFSNEDAARMAAQLLQCPYWIFLNTRPISSSDLDLLKQLSAYTDAGFFKEPDGEIRSIHEPCWGSEFMIDPIQRRVSVMLMGTEIYSRPLFDSPDQLNAYSGWKRVTHAQRSQTA